MLDIRFKEFRNEIPYNTVKTWSKALMEQAHWLPIGWSGESKEPYRHWACYPEFDGILINIWDAISPTAEDEGLKLKPERIIMNLYNHGDSAWLHKDSDSEKDWTVIIFLNEYWNINWGGDFVLAENDELLASFAPTPGKFVIFQSNILHAARPVSREAPFPRFGVAFQCKHDSNIQGLQKPKISSIRSAL